MATVTEPATTSGIHTNGANGVHMNGAQTPEKATWRSKVGLAEMLKGGVIMDVVNAQTGTHR